MPARTNHGLLSTLLSLTRACSVFRFPQYFHRSWQLRRYSNLDYAKSYKGKPILYCWRYWFHICNFYWTVALGRAQLSFNSIAQIVPASFTPVLLEELMFYLSTFRLPLSDGKIFTTMEWLMVFCQSTIVVDGFSMVFRCASISWIHVGESVSH